MNPEIISDQNEVDSELRALGLTREILLESLQVGLSERATTTENHPSNYSGIKMWAEVTCSLGDALVRQGWTRDNSKNLASTISADKTIALIVASGDMATGDSERPPTTRHDRGVMTQQRVRSNQKVLEFNDEARAVNRAADFMTNDLKGTWMLLHCIIDGELRCELSRPIAIDESGHVRQWSKRLILPPLPLEPARAPTLDDEPILSLPRVLRRGNE